MMSVVPVPVSMSVTMAMSAKPKMAVMMTAAEDGRSGD
jgi:hypothetical protein